MSDFVEFTKDDGWAYRPGPQTTEGVGRDPLKYIEQAPVTQEQITIVAGNQSLAPASGSVASKEIQPQNHVANSFLWPLRSFQEQRATPFIAAIIAGVFVGPLIMADAALTGLMLGGYIGGMGTYWAASSYQNIEKPTSPIKQFIAQKETSVQNTSTLQTLDQIPYLPVASTVSDEIQGHLRGI